MTSPETTSVAKQRADGVPSNVTVQHAGAFTWCDDAVTVRELDATLKPTLVRIAEEYVSKAQPLTFNFHKGTVSTIQKFESLFSA